MPPSPTTDLARLYADGVAHLRAGRGAEAKAAFKAVLAQRPDAPEPLFQLGRCLTAEGDLVGAEEVLRRALAVRPKDPAIWQALHATLRGAAQNKLEKQAQRAKVTLGTEAEVRPILSAIARGQAAKAEAAALDLTRRAPGTFWPALALGEARLSLGKPAVAPLEAAHQIDPENPRGRLALARALLAGGVVGRVEALLSPASPEAAIALAQLYRATARPEQAVAVLEAARGKDAAAAAELGLSLAACGQGQRALEAARTAVSRGAKREPLLRMLAHLAEEAGDVSGAEAAIDAGLSAGRSAALLTHRAQLRQSDGDLDGAEADLLAAMDEDPAHAAAFRAYANGRKLRAEDPVCAQLETALARLELAKADRSELHFAAAKVAQDQGRTADEASHLSTANRLMAELYPYGFDADRKTARALAADAEALDEVAAAGKGPEDRVIFVTGLPRSGTTLVETVLAAHADTSAGGEMPFLSRALAPAVEALRDGTAGPHDFAEAGRRYVAAARRRTGAGVILDKAISTFSRAGHALAALPHAYVVLVRRDPMDTGLSLFRNMFPHGMHRYAYDLQQMGRYIRLHDAIAGFWQERYPDRVHWLDYDALTRAPEETIRALLEQVGLPWDPNCLTPESAGGRIQTLSFAQARQPISTGSVGGAQRHAELLQPLADALRDPVTLDHPHPEATG